MAPWTCQWVFNSEAYPTLKINQKAFVFQTLLPIRKELKTPLRVSTNRRHLETADGKPFFWAADTAWELFHRLDREDATRYLENRAAKGFTVIQAVILAELDGLDTPNVLGDKPLQDNDPARPNEAYFRHVDFIVDEAARLGLVIGLLPTWGSYWGTGKHNRPIFDEKNARVYGKFLGQRYGQKPVVWILGGDRYLEDEKNIAVNTAMGEGLREGDRGRNLLTFHPRGPGRSSEEWHHTGFLDFHMCQTSHISRGHDPGLSIAADYALEPPLPTLDGEPRYENLSVGFYHTGNSTLVRFDDTDTRTAAWWALLAGACGHTYGHSSIWQMWEPGRQSIISANTPWYEAIDHPGGFQMGFLARLWQSRPWEHLKPDPDFVLNAPKTGPGLVRGAWSADPSLAFVYSSEGEPFSIDLSRFQAHNIRISWFDPRYGVLYLLHTHRNIAYQTFTPPTSGRGQDWVLVLEDATSQAPLELFQPSGKVTETREVDRPADW